MSEHNWKPGDVVTATVKGRENVRLVAGWSKYVPQLRWCEMSPRWGDGDDDECWFMPSQVSDHRRLVTIDPENRDDVDRFRQIASRLADEVPYDDDAGSYTTAMQAAFREYATPPLAEPTDPATRITDQRDNIWRLLADGEWVCTSGPDIGEYLRWAHLAERGARLDES